MNTDNNVAATVEALQARIKELEASLPAQKESSVSLGEYNGHRVLKFEGAFRPFSLGFAKVRHVLALAERAQSLMAQADKEG